MILRDVISTSYDYLARHMMFLARHMILPDQDVLLGVLYSSLLRRVGCCAIMLQGLPHLLHFALVYSQSSELPPHASVLLHSN